MSKVKCHQEPGYAGFVPKLCLAFLQVVCHAQLALSMLSCQSEKSVLTVGHRSVSPLLLLLGQFGARDRPSYCKIRKKQP